MVSRSDLKLDCIFQSGLRSRGVGLYSLAFLTGFKKGSDLGPYQTVASLNTTELIFIVSFYPIW